MGLTPDTIERDSRLEFSDVKESFLITNYLKFLFSKPELVFDRLFGLKHLKIAACSGNPSLARLIGIELAKKVDPILEQVSPSDAVRIFPDGELRPQFRDSLRQRHTIIFQSFAPSWSKDESGINDQIVELLLACEGAKRASAKEITLFLPYMAYMRSDRKDMSRVAIGAKALINALVANGADRFVAMDIHKDQIAGFADVFDIIYSSEFFLPIIRRLLDVDNLVVMSPDSSDGMAEGWCKRLLGHPQNGKVKKFRDKETGQSTSYNYSGPDVKDRDVLIVDDLIARATTIVQAAQTVKKLEARNIFVVAPHGLFLGDALEKIKNSVIDRVLVTNSVRPRPDIFDEEATGGKIIVFNIASFLAAKMMRVHTGKTMGID